MLQIVRTHEDDEFLGKITSFVRDTAAYYPKYTRLHKVVKAKYDQLCSKVQDLYNITLARMKENPETTFWKEMLSVTQSTTYRDILTKMFVNKLDDVKSYCQQTDIAVLSKQVEAETVQISISTEKEAASEEKKLYEEIEGIVNPLTKQQQKKLKKSFKQPAKAQGFEIDDVSMVPGARVETLESNNNNNNNADNIEKSNNNNTAPKEPKPKPNKASSAKPKKNKTDADLDNLIAHFKKLDEQMLKKEQEAKEDDEDTPTRSAKKKSKSKKKK